ncbi:DUF397 domain-containing protein [Streptomyces sp. NBC_00838]|uniref:DUF397 domain-containing protein n=1 Tax=Streptomyces sp. NBC_00838 TaxID=2903680 RepID=UPI00386C9C86|nr:DUF397 domain-containing protein [Streptomyces sp. NBC_00838]
MTTTADTLANASWFKSSYSNDQGGACVEGAQLPGGAMAVRDSKNPHGPAFVLTGAAWTAFVGALVGGEF